jgi:glycosyltransferase involved in cell wall biosynthesis
VVTQLLRGTGRREQRSGVEVFRFESTEETPFTMRAATSGLFDTADVLCMFGLGHDEEGRWWMPLLDGGSPTRTVRLLKVGSDGDIPLRGIGPSLYARLDGVLCQTPRIAARAIGVPSACCFPVRNGIPLSAWRTGAPDRRDARAVLGVPADTFVALGLGRFTRRKRFPALVGSFAGFAGASRCRTQGPPPVLILHGSDFGQSDGEEARLRAMVDDWRPPLSVRFVPPSVDPRVTLSASDVVVTLSEREGAPNIFIEALCVGRPVLASDLPGHRIYVRQGIEGILVPPFDDVAAAAALCDLHGDGDRRRRMESAARARAARFDIVRTVSDYLRAFEVSRRRRQEGR